MKKPTIYEIRRRVEDKQPYFFSRKTLRFFGQTMRDFSVERSPNGNLYIVAPTYMVDRSVSGAPRYRHVSYTVRRVAGDTLETVPHFPGSGLKDYAPIRKYIEEN